MSTCGDSNIYYIIQLVIALCLITGSYINLFQKTIGYEYSLYHSIHCHGNNRIDIDEMMNLKKESNTVFITVATYGYREFTLDFYQSNHLQDYSSFFVVVHDKRSYDVRISLFVHS